LFSEYPATDVHPLLLDFYGSVMITSDVLKESTDGFDLTDWEGSLRL